MRCLALAEALQRKGARCLFLCRGAGLGTLADRITGAGHQAVLIPEGPPLEAGASSSPPLPPHASWLPHGWNWDAQCCLEALGKYPPPDWLVVDHYALDARWEQTLKPAIGHCLVIDDLADRNHDCDLLVDQNLHTDVLDRYEKLIPRRCVRLMGPHYALIRPEFARERMASPEKTVPEIATRIIIMFGGADNDDLTGQTVEIISQLNTKCHLEIVIGPLYAQRAMLIRRVAEIQHAVVHVNPDNLARLMAQADLAIGSPGITSWERCTLGLPAIAIAVADNQEAMAQALAHRGAHIYLGRHTVLAETDLAAAAQLALNNRPLRQHMSLTANGLTDGQGARRVAGWLISPEITFRPATAADTRMLYEWRNTPEVRRYAFDNAAIPWETHTQWFLNARADPNTHILIAREADSDVGCIRFNLTGQEARISIYLNPCHLGRGLSVPILKAAKIWLATEHPNIMRINAEVKADNEPSKRAFQGAGYLLAHHVFTQCP